MSNYRKILGITALMLAPMSGYALGSDTDENAEAYVTRMLELRAQEREVDQSRQAEDRKPDEVRELNGARAREMTRLVEEVLSDADRTARGLGANSHLSLDPTALRSSGSTSARSGLDARRAVDPHDGVSLGAFGYGTSIYQDELQPDEGAAEGGDEGGLVQKSDKSGTNPLNFKSELRFYNEYQYLSTVGDGWQNVTTTEFRMPIADGKWSFRVRARAAFLEADLNGDGVDDVDESGLGDTDIRFLTVPVIIPEKKFAFAIAMEVFFDTASDDALGSGSTALGPQFFLGFFQPFGLPIDGFFPGYQHQFSVDGNDLNRSLIDLYLYKTFNNKQQWLLVDPAIIIDHEAETEYLLIDLEFGTMLETEGHSAWIRPAFGIGNDRPIDASIEVGYKMVW